MTTVISGSSPSITFSDATTQSTAFTTPVSVANGGTGSSTLAGANIATTNSSTQSITSINTFGFKNRIINGGMVIDQRNAGASVTITGSTYNLDRWYAYVSVGSKFSIQQNAGSITPPAGYTNYMGITSSSAYTVGASELFLQNQFIEGYNIADLAWGTASAKAVTLSFWVRSTGLSYPATLGGVLTNSDNSYCYPFSYSITSGSTWQQITVSITAPTSGTWNTNNGVGVGVRFSLGVGSSNQGTAGAWTSSSVFSPTGCVNLVGTSGATLYITGVQLEVGTQATSFDFRDYGRELILCQRYYQASSYGTTTYPSSTGYARAYASFPVIMRTAPTMVFVDQGSGGSSLGSGSYTNGYWNTYQSLGSSAAGTFTWTATSEL